MSEPSDAQSGKDATPSKPASASKHSFDHLPEVDSPSISPAGRETEKAEPVKGETNAAGGDSKENKQTAQDSAAADQSDAAPGQLMILPRTERARERIKMPRMNITMSRRTRRNAMRAATLLIAAGLGATAGVLSTYVLPSKTPKQDVALLEERQAMQKSIVLLAKEVTALKSNIDKAEKSIQTQVGKISARVDAAKREDKHSDDIVTGSIKTASAPAAAASSAIANATAATITAPLPQPRPAVAQVVKGWSAYVAPDGAILVEQQGGDLFQVSAGAPLPGLGRVEAIRRDGGQVEVVTAKGIIVSPPRRTVRRSYDRFPPFFERY
jgi:hypothetical protein